MISVIIPTYSRSNLLIGALNSLLHQTLPFSEFEVIIVDNNSADNTRDVSLEFIKTNKALNVKYFLELVPGLLAARHRGYKESVGDILVYIDEDVQVSLEFLNEVKRTFNQSENIGLLTGKVLPKYEITPPGWLEYFWQSHSNGKKICGWLSLLDFGDDVCEIEHYLIWGVNFSIKRSVLEQVGGFNPDSISEELFYCGGDGETGLAMKVKAIGLKAIYNPRVMLLHCIEKERLVKEYFRKRAKIQGKCDSYTLIREKHVKPGKSEVIKAFFNYYLFTVYYFLRRGVPKKWSEQYKLEADFKRYYLKSYYIHHKLVSKHNDLFNWVIKSNYWEYEPPNIILKK